MNLETTQFDIIRSQPPSNYKNLKKLNNNNSCNNNFKYCFNKLYYDCKHLIVLIIVECRHVLADFPKLAEKLSVIRTDRHENLVRPKNILPVRKKVPKNSQSHA